MKQNEFASVLLACLLALVSIASANAQGLTPQQQKLFDEGARLYSEAFELFQNEKPDEALKPAQRALEIILQTKGENSADAANARNLVGNILMDQFKFDAAQEQFERVLEIRKKVHGERGAETASAWFNLGILFVNRQKFDDALRCYRQSLEIFREAKGSQSMNAVKSLLRIAEVARQKGDYPASMAGFREVLQIVRSNPDIAPTVEGWTLRELAMTYGDMMDYSASLKHYELALPIFRRAYGDNSADMALILDNLGMAYSSTEDLVTAQYVGTCPGDSFTRLRSRWLNHRQFILEFRQCSRTDCGDEKTARVYLEKAVTIHEKSYGPDHPETAKAYNNLGLLLSMMQENEAARRYQEKASGDPTTSSWREPFIHRVSPHGTGEQPFGCGQMVRTPEQLEKALTVRLQLEGEQHIGTSDVLNNLAVALNMLGEIEASLKNYRRSVEIRRKLLGDMHPSTVRLIANLAFQLESNHKTDEAIKLLDESRRGTRSYVTRLLPNLSEQEQLKFLTNYDETKFQGSLLVAWLHRDDFNIAARSAEWLINGKATAQESLAVKTLLAVTPPPKRKSLIECQCSWLPFPFPRRRLGRRNRVAKSAKIGSGRTATHPSNRRRGG